MYQLRLVSLGLITDWIDKHLSDDDRRYLLADFTPHDVKFASFNIHPDKAPGIDGLNSAFYQITEILLAIMLLRHVSLESKANPSLQKSKTQSWS